MDIKQFIQCPIIQKYADLPIWTVSDKNKRPIDFKALKTEQLIRGASFEADNQPLVSLYDIVNTNLNVTNVCCLLNQSAYSMVILDIEPDCPDDRKQELMGLPCSYMETSMSGHGIHMLFESVDTDYKDILMSKQVIKEEHKYYEYLLNRHYITFTGNMIEHQATRPIGDIKVEFDQLASVATLTKIHDFDTSNLPDIQEIPQSIAIIERLISEVVYQKTPCDFKYDLSKYEYGHMGYIYIRLLNLLNSAPFNEYKYNQETQLILLYEASRILIPYREKHEGIRQNLPYLMYVAKRMISTSTESR